MKTANYNQELYHYGIKGMKWGVRRATKTLGSSKASAEKKTKAVQSLQKHQTKANKKIAKLEKQHAGLKKQADKFTTRTDIRTAAMKNQAAKTRMKAYGTFTSQRRAESYLYEADKLEAQAAALVARKESLKAKVAKNERLQEMFNEGVANIDKTLATTGKKYLDK